MSLYEHSDVRVTRTMITVGGSNFPLTGVTGYRTGYHTDSHVGAAAVLAIAAFGLTWGLIGCVGLVLAVLNVSGYVVGPSLAGVAAGAVSIAAGLAAWSRMSESRRTPYRLWLITAAGEVTALTSGSLAEVHDVASAIERAIALRG